MKHDNILQICKEIVQAEQALNLTVDKLLIEVGVTHEEAKNGLVKR